MKRLAWALGAALVPVVAGWVAGCEVSVFGSEPIVLISEHTAGGTTMAHACEEPAAAHTARTAAEGSEEGCVLRCSFSVDAASPFTCEAAQPATDANGVSRAYVLALDMRQYDGVVLTLEICDPDGVVLQMSDSSTASPTGGDAGSSSHDADFLLQGTTLHLRPSATAETPGSQMDGFVSESGCTTRTVVVSEQLVYLVDSERGLCGPGVFRIDPPTDPEGHPDALWFLSTSGAVDGSAEGSGLRSVQMCFW